MMRRGFLIVLLSLGAIFGFASGVHHLRHGDAWHGGWCGEHQNFEQHIAEVCADAALRARPASMP